MEAKQSVNGGPAATSMVAQIAAMQDYDRYRDLAWEGSFEEYLAMVRDRPQVTRNAFQRMYDMVISYGTEEYIDNKKKLIRYNFFRDEIDEGKDAIFGLDIPLMRLLNVLKAASEGYGPERRVILLHGPVGSSKSTIARLLKKGLERYSTTHEGALFTFKWVNLAETGLASGEADIFDSPMHEEPLRLIPQEWREQSIKKLGLSNEKFKVRIDGDLDPASRFIFQGLIKRYEGDWGKVMANHIRVKRLTLSEKDRVGIGTFQPKDEKNQDSTELTGDINYRKIAEYGSDSDPRAFNFDGEFNIANRGIVEFIEVLKLDVAFLYDLLGASQEHKIKPKKFAQTDIDEVIIGHTNEPEYKKLQSNEMMEAFRDRTVKIDVPYNVRLSDEIAIYQRDFNRKNVKKHIAPHTIEIAAMWAVLTRLEEPKKASLSLLQKMKLYSGKTLPGFTQDNVHELKMEAPREGMNGISPRYIQDKLSNALVSLESTTSVNPFMVLNELEAGLAHHSLISNDDLRKK